MNITVTEDQAVDKLWNMIKIAKAVKTKDIPKHKCSTKGCENQIPITWQRCKTCNSRRSKRKAAGKPLNAPLYYRAKTAKGCSVPGCKKPFKANGFCDNHYHQFYRKKKIFTITLANKPMLYKKICMMAMEQGLTIPQQIYKILREYKNAKT